jgi:hypothetical protein
MTVEEKPVVFRRQCPEFDAVRELRARAVIYL